MSEKVQRPESSVFDLRKRVRARANDLYDEMEKVREGDRWQRLTPELRTKLSELMDSYASTQESHLIVWCHSAQETLSSIL